MKASGGRVQLVKAVTTKLKYSNFIFKIKKNIKVTMRAIKREMHPFSMHFIQQTTEIKFKYIKKNFILSQFILFSKIP